MAAKFAGRPRGGRPVILVVTTTLSIYKPQGLTRYEARIEAK